MINEIISAVLILLGAVFMLISAIGMIRLPDFYIRNSASTKAVVLGLTLILLGVGLYYNDILVFIEVFAILFFIYLISPLAAHIMARAAVLTKVPFWKNTELKELSEYEKEKSSEDQED